MCFTLYIKTPLALDPEAFSGQMRYIIRPAGSESPPSWSSPQGGAPEDPHQVPEPPEPARLNVELLVLSEAEHRLRFYLRPGSSGRCLQLVIQLECGNVDGPVHEEY